MVLFVEFPVESNAKQVRNDAMNVLNKLVSAVEPREERHTENIEGTGPLQQEYETAYPVQADPDYEAISEDSDSDSDFDMVLPTPPKMANQDKFQSLETLTTMNYFINKKLYPNSYTVRTYLQHDKYMRERVNQCLMKYSPTTRERRYRTMVC